MNKTIISWTDHTWNPTSGCSKISDGCSHCYAETISLRFNRSRKPWAERFSAENVRIHPDRLAQPFKLKPGTKCFVNSMSDLFHPQISLDFVDQVFAVMALCPDVTFQVLTKRTARMAAYLNDPAGGNRILQMAHDLFRERLARAREKYAGNLNRFTWPMRNVWPGTSVESQREADNRIPALLKIRGEWVLWLSVEPLLGPIRFERDWLNRLSWVALGGESGTHMAKPENRDRWMKMEWAREIRDQCAEAGVAFLMKQQSGLRTEMNQFIKETDGSRWVWRQFPGQLTPPWPYGQEAPAIAQEVEAPVLQAALF